MGEPYCTTVGAFSGTDAHARLGVLVSNVAQSGISSQRREQIEAWQDSFPIIESMARTLGEMDATTKTWTLILEYEIPRRACRPDLILLARDVIFVIEFKVGADAFHAADRWQARDYGLDLRDFHRESRGRMIVSILVATNAPGSRPISLGPVADSVPPVQCVNPATLAERIARMFEATSDPLRARIEMTEWLTSAYRPTPTIVEAAQTLFRGNRVADITHGFATNLTDTTQALVRAISDARTTSSRTICFVTGIPGAGKTLTGLNAAHDPTLRTNEEAIATFLSGNGPLISVIHESLVRDAMKRGVRRQDAKHSVSAFIHDVHRFMREHGIEKPTEPPPEHVIIFDEAQRAWDTKQMQKKRKLARSEADLILEIMGRAEGWATVIALVGGGQEINDGEAGLEEWGRALQRTTRTWNVVASPEVLRGGQSVAGHRLFSSELTGNLHVLEHAALHLSSNVRSARAQWLGGWVNSLLDHDQAGSPPGIMDGDFPVVVTRDLETAKLWVRSMADPMERFGLVASSGGLRLRASGIEVSSGFRSGYPYHAWFLDDPSGVLSSNRFEVAATEFECQGLELDWTLVCWGGDLLIDDKERMWRQRAFRGAKWTAVRSAVKRQFISNKYRVLLTRARRGMAIWVPRGDASDTTRDPQGFDATAQRLVDAGVETI